MKRLIWSNLIVAIAVALLGSGNNTGAQPAPLAYQGRLTENGAPATGTYAMEFKLFDVPELGFGVQKGGTITDSSVSVNDGAFTVTLDFGASAFDGSLRYLEISVSQAGAGTPLRVLSPRQEVRLVPYAIHSLSAAQLDGVAAASFVRAVPNGSVGIGTPDPKALLHLYHQPESLTQLIETGGGTNAWTKVGFKNLNGEWDIGTSRGFNSDVFYIDRLGSDRIEFQLSPGGGLGLGIEPRAKLHLYEPDSVTHLIESGGGVNAWAKVSFRNARGQWDIGTSREYNGDQFYISRPGAPSVAFGVQPNGDVYAAGDITGTRLFLRPDPFAPRNAAVLTQDPGVENFVPYNTALNRAMSLIVHDASVRTLEIRGGADLAEPFPMKESEIEKGSVVVIDEQETGRLKMSTQAYDRRVAGIVSGANGINPGISLRQEGVADEGEYVALTGRVYVRADATTGAIEPGDLLTTSDTPGHAMRVADHTRAQGAILGKAMSRLKEGKGMVLVLVTLQ
ncbi:MAG: hypothetical protein JNN07_15350 [Verrucomicrobiales bacterium]|nr:hypothetical protein [Verrucomicrobiales bacterium]